MAKPTAHEKWVSASSAWCYYENQAGIREDLNKELPYIGHLAHPSNEREREIYRRIIFGVPDLDRRRDVIRASRECFKWALETYNSEFNARAERIISGGEPIRRNALLGAIGIGIFLVYIGTIFGEKIWNFISDSTGGGYLNNRGALIGALAGAVVSLLWGFDSILHADRYAVEDVAEATKENREAELPFPSLDNGFLFSEAEETTGMPST